MKSITYGIVLQEKLMDTVERLRSLNDGLLMCGNDYSDVLLDAAKDVESLRQQLDAAEANCQCELIKLEQQLAESQARNAADGWRQCAKGQRTTQYCGLTEQAIRQAKREALLEAINEWEKPYGLTDGIPFIKRLHRMADNLKD